MAINFSKLTDPELENLVENYRRKRATTEKVYADALEEIARRRGKGLDFAKSFELIVQAAKRHQFVSYKELADGSGADWSRVHYVIGEHLWRLVEYAERRGWPMLSAIVVNKRNVDSGEMEPDTLKGFVAAARALGKSITDEGAFLRSQQEAVFRWAAEEWQKTN